MLARLHLGASLVALALACNPDPGGASAEASSGSGTGANTGDTGEALSCKDPVPTGTEDVVIECPGINRVYFSGTEVWTNYLRTQEDVDKLAGCTHVSDSLSIGDDAVDLTPLASLRHIAGDLTISGPITFPRERGGPASLAGLEGLRHVGGLHLEALPLTDLCPLAGLTDVPGEVRLTRLPGLTSLEGLHNLTNVGDALSVGDCANLQDLGGLRGLQRVGRRIQFSELPITSLRGLEALGEVGTPGEESSVGLYSLPNLTSLDGLGLPWRAEHEISLYLTALPDLGFLAGVEELTALRLDGNDMLTTLGGLESLAVVRGELRLGRNSKLLDITALASLEALGALTLEDTSLTDLGPLPALAQPGDLRLVGNEQLTSLTSLAGRTTLRSLVLESNPMLEHLPELAALAQVEGDLELRRSAMTDLLDLAAVTSVGDRLAVVDNGELLQTDAEAWAAPILVSGVPKIFLNKGDDQPDIDPCPWPNDGQCDYICIDDGFDCASD